MKILNIGGIYTNPFGNIFIILGETNRIYYFFLIDLEKEKTERTNEKINNYLSARIEYDQRLDLIQTDIIPFFSFISKNEIVPELIDGYIGLIDDKILNTLKIYLKY